MEQSNENNVPIIQNGKEFVGGNKKYNFYRKPSLKKKAPEVKQTLTSYKRMLNANPLLKYEMEGKDLSLANKHLPSSSSSLIRGDNTSDKQSLRFEKHPMELYSGSGKSKGTNIHRSNSLKNPPKLLSRPLNNGTSSIISGNKPYAKSKTISISISKQSRVDFNNSTSRFLCSTRLETNASKIHNKMETKELPQNKTKHVYKTSSSTQDNLVSSSVNSVALNKERKKNPIRRSLSAQHLDRKKGTSNIHPEKCFSRTQLTQSLEDIPSLKHNNHLQYISPIAEGSRESSIIFKTPSAYERRSIAKYTPKSATSNRRSLYHPSTPLPSLNDLQNRLNDWLLKRGKSLSSFHHLKCFGIEETKPSEIDEENKENIEVSEDLDKSSYEDLKITPTSCSNNRNANNNKPLVLSEENSEKIAKAALEDLHKLIQEGYPRPQCEGWLELIRQKYRRLEDEPEYWECRAAIEQSRGNISNAVQCYKTAIVQGAEIQSVDESLDVLLQKFSLLNITTDHTENEKSIKERARIIQDARNVFKSSIIQFAVQERKLKKNCREEDTKKLIATPVRRSTRLSRSAYTSTPGVKICSSLQDLDTSDRNMVAFKKNKALF